MLTVIALGGNALLQPGEKGTLKEQIHNAENAMKPVSAFAVYLANFIFKFR